MLFGLACLSYTYLDLGVEITAEILQYAANNISGTVARSAEEFQRFFFLGRFCIKESPSFVFDWLSKEQ